MASDLTIVTTCLNEEDNIESFIFRAVEAARKNSVDIDLVVVDDGSTDETAEKLKDLEVIYSMLKVVTNSPNKGIVESWRVALAEVNTDLICLIDSDLQNAPEDIYELYGAYQGSKGLDEKRFVQGYRVPEKTDLRAYISKGFNRLLNLVFGMSLKDNKSGFLLGEKVALQAALVHKYSYYYFQSFISVSLVKNGYVIVEKPTIFYERTRGSSFIAGIPIKEMCRCFIDLAKAAVEFGGR
jgi:glycosyltransferase involved in cell wall biosynthesis